MRVLLVEDNAAIGNAVRDHLCAEGWAVDWAMDLSSATAAVAADRYGIVLLDIRLPDGNGLDLLRYVRAKAASTPVIIMSAYDQFSDRMAGMSIGAIDYLVKPFALSELTARIRRVIASPDGRMSRSAVSGRFSEAS